MCLNDPGSYTSWDLDVLQRLVHQVGGWVMRYSPIPVKKYIVTESRHTLQDSRQAVAALCVTEPEEARLVSRETTRLHMYLVLSVT